MKNTTQTFIPSPDREPPASTRGPLTWLRENLFGSVKNSILTVLSILLLLSTLPKFLSWAFLRAVWAGDAAMCKVDEAGACWSFIGAKFRVLMIGVYPAEESWRPLIGGAILLILVVLSITNRLKGRGLLIMWLLVPFFGYWMMGGGLGLHEVDQSRWGGLMLSLLLAIVGIIISIPLGILLALARTSRIAALKAVAVGIIEVVRGVPLITILFMASVMLPLFLPEGVIINNMLRIQIGMIIFSAAYVAEVVRGGLQAMPKGQYEAADAIGLNGWQSTWYIILPQALRYVLPPLIGRCIALFKDTSLVIIVGLLDFLGMIKNSSLDAEWLGFETEAYVFGAFVYWVVCYSLSLYGSNLERNNKTTH